MATDISEKGSKMQTDSYSPQPENELKTVLTSFETTLLTPTVAGELPSWLEDVQKTWAEASANIHYHTKHLHPRQFEEIGKQDPELFPRIELLQSEDEAIERDREHFSQLIGRVGEHAPKLEPDEEKAEKYIKSVVDAGTTFLIRVRKQEVAIQTWYVEAFNRDRGPVD